MIPYLKKTTQLRITNLLRTSMLPIFVNMPMTLLICLLLLTKVNCLLTIKLIHYLVNIKYPSPPPWFNCQKLKYV